MTAIPVTAAEITREWLTTALRKGGTIDESAAVADVSVRPIGNGQIGQVLKAELTYSQPGAGPASLMVKLPALEESRRQMATALGIYDSEVRFYREIAPRVDIATPSLYGSEIEYGTGNFVLLLEDLTLTATVGDTVSGVRLDRARAAVAALPGLQAPFWDAKELIDDAWWGDHSRGHLYFTTVPLVRTSLEDRFGPLLSPEHQAMMSAVAAVAERLQDQIWTAPFVVGHGDYRADNMMFSADGDTSLSVIDWQGTKLAPPLVDVATFIGLNLTPQERREYERDLVDTYHRALAAAGIEALSRDDCWHGYRLGALYPLLGVMMVATSMAHTSEDEQLWLHLLRQTLQMVIDLKSMDLIK